MAGCASSFSLELLESLIQCEGLGFAPSAHRTLGPGIPSKVLTLAPLTLLFTLRLRWAPAGAGEDEHELAFDEDEEA